MPGFHVHLAWAPMPRRWAFDGYSGSGTVLLSSTAKHALASYEVWCSDGSPYMTPMLHYDWTYQGTLSDVSERSISQRPGVKQIRKAIGRFAEVRGERRVAHIPRGGAGAGHVQLCM